MKLKKFGCENFYLVKRHRYEAHRSIGRIQAVAHLVDSVETGAVMKTLVTRDVPSQ